jgi:hypothetical protein
MPANKCPVEGCKDNAAPVFARTPDYARSMCLAHRDRECKRRSNAALRAKKRENGAKPKRAKPAVVTKARPVTNPTSTIAQEVARCLEAIAALGGIDRAERIAAAFR